MPFARRVSCSKKQQPDKAQAGMPVPCPAFMLLPRRIKGGMQNGPSRRKNRNALLQISVGGSVIFGTKRGGAGNGDGTENQYFTAAVIGSVILSVFRVARRSYL